MDSCRCARVSTYQKHAFTCEYVCKCVSIHVFKWSQIMEPTRGTAKATSPGQLFVSLGYGPRCRGSPHRERIRPQGGAGKIWILALDEKVLLPEPREQLSGEEHRPSKLKPRGIWGWGGVSRSLIHFHVICIHIYL